MKTCFLYFFTWIALNSATGQIEGIWPDEASPMAGVENFYNYLPPEGVYMPKEMYAHAFFKTNQLQIRRMPLIKQGSQYRFSVEVPDSIASIIVGLFDKTGLLIDNNHGKGYLLSLDSENGDRKGRVGLTTTETLLTSARKMLQLTLDRSAYIDFYESSYKLNPDLKDDDTYLTYLRLLYYEKKDSVTNYLLKYEGEMETEQKEESKLLRAFSIYSLLNIEDRQENLEKRILELYPNGNFAASQFMSTFRGNENLSDFEITSKMEHFVSRFDDPSEYAIDEFYIRLLNKAIVARNLPQIMECEKKLVDKMLAVDIYNEAAKQVLDRPIPPVGDWDFIRLALKRSIGIPAIGIENEVEKNQLSQAIQNYARFSIR